MLATLAVAVFAAGVAAAPSAGVIRGLSPTGSDGGGTDCVARPCRTFEYALGEMQCGDSLVVQGSRSLDDIYEETLKFSADDLPCSQTRQIVVQAAAGDRPLIEGCLSLSNMTWWTWDGIDVAWPGTIEGNPAWSCPNGQNHMVKLDGGSNWTWTRSEVWGSHNLANILVSNTSDGPPNDWTISQSCIHDNLSTDSPKSHNIYVGDIAGSRGGTITRNFVFRATAGMGIKLGPGDQRDGIGPSDVLVAYNTIFDSSEHSILVSDDSKWNVLDHNLLLITGDGTARSVIRGNDTGPNFWTNLVMNEAWWDPGSDFIEYVPDPPDPDHAFRVGPGNLRARPDWIKGPEAGCAGFRQTNESPTHCYGADGVLPSPEHPEC